MQPFVQPFVRADSHRQAGVCGSTHTLDGNRTLMLDRTTTMFRRIFVEFGHMTQWASVLLAVSFVAGCALEPRYIPGDPVHEAIRKQQFPVCPAVEYPPMARQNEQQGTSELELLVSVEGKVQQASIARSSGFSLLDEAAIQHAKTCQFEVRNRNGTPMPYKTNFKMHWQLW